MLNRNNPEPLYAQLERILRQQIADGTWAPVTTIPSENELSRQYGVSRMTARSVVTALVRDGLLYRVQGKGTFIPERKISTQSPAYLGIREQLEAQGYRTETKLLSFEKEPASSRIASSLHIQEGEPVYVISRLRLAGQTPISIHMSYLPAALCPSLQAQDFSGERQLCHILQQDHHLVTATVEEALESVLATKRQATLLEIPPKSPLLLLSDCNKDAESTIFEYSRIWFRGDKIKLHFTLQAGEVPGLSF